MPMRVRRLLVAIGLANLLLPICAAYAQSQMPDQRAASRMTAGRGLVQRGRTMSLSIPVAANNGGAGTVAGILKANGAGVVSAAVAGSDYAPPSSGTSLLKGNGTGGFSAALSGADYAPATSGTSILKGNGAGAFTNAAPGSDYAPPTTGNALLKGNGTGGFAGAVSGTDYAPASSGSSMLKGNGAGGFSSATSGTDYQAPILANSLAAHNFANSISSAGSLSGAQPGFADLSGSLASSQMPALTGDTISSAGSSVTTNVRVNGVSYSSSPPTDTAPVITAANTATYTPISNCPDGGGNHLNYSTISHTFSCGTSSSTTTSSFSAAMLSSTALNNYGGL